jgi:hypothetical protein
MVVTHSNGTDGRQGSKSQDFGAREQDGVDQAVLKQK